MPNYIKVIADCFPGAEAYTGGDPTVYEDLIWVTIPIDQATLDASDCAVNPQNYVDPTPVETVIPEGTPNDGETIVYDANTGQFVTQPPSIIGSTFNLNFQYESSNVKNKWLSYSGGNSFTSNSVPAVIPFACELIGIMFSNRDDGIDADVKIYKADAGSSAVNNLLLTWQIRNARVGYKTDLTGYSFVPGDKLGIFIEDAGTDLDYPIITLMFKITNKLPGEATENFSGYF